MQRRTQHGQQRHEQGDRPTREAFRDRQNPLEVYLDQETGCLVYVGRQGRTHFFTQDGKHHTSFYTSRRGRLHRMATGRWIHLKTGQRADTIEDDES